jgi:hypothetical protein
MLFSLKLIQIVGEAIAWLYGLAFLDALYMVEKDVKVHKEGNLVKGTSIFFDNHGVLVR